MPWEVPLRFDEGSGYSSEFEVSQDGVPSDTLYYNGVEIDKTVQPHDQMEYEVAEFVSFFVEPAAKADRPITVWQPMPLPAAAPVVPTPPPADLENEFPWGTFGGVVTTPPAVPQPDVKIAWEWAPAVDAPEGGSFAFGGAPQPEAESEGWFGKAFDWTKDNLLFGTPFDEKLAEARENVHSVLPDVAMAGMSGLLLVMMLMDDRR